MAMASSALNTHNSAALRQQVELHDKGRDALKRAFLLMDAGDTVGSLQLFRSSMAFFGHALAVRSQFSPQEWEKARNLHEKIQNTYNVIKDRVKELERQYEPPRHATLTTARTNSAPTLRHSRSAPPSSASASSSGRPLSLKNVDSKLADTILNEIVDQGPGVKWEDVVGLERAKAALQETVILPALRPDLFSGLREPARGVLLFGPPGTGKTLLAKAVATESQSKFFSISASSLTSKYMGESEKLVRALFAVAAELQPSVVFVDEIDSILSSRGGDSEAESSRRLKTEFLIQWDGVNAASNARVLILAATNFPAQLDEAVRRRFSRRIYIPLPDFSARAQTVRQVMRSQPHNLSDADLQFVAAATEGYSGSDLKNLAKEAAMMPIRELGARIRDIRADQLRPVSKRDFEAAIRVVRPSVSPSSIAQYDDFDRQFGS